MSILLITTIIKTKTTLLIILIILSNLQILPFIDSTTNHTTLTRNKLNNKTKHTTPKENESTIHFPFLIGTTSTKGSTSFSTIGYNTGSWILALTSNFIFPLIPMAATLVSSSKSDPRL